MKCVYIYYDNLSWKIFVICFDFSITRNMLSLIPIQIIPISSVNKEAAFDHLPMHHAMLSI